MPSSVIRRMHYNPGARTLDVVFRDGRGVYRYFDVPNTEWEAFRSAPSKGAYLNETFKEGGYGYEKLAVSEREPTEPTQAAPHTEWGDHA